MCAQFTRSKHTNKIGLCARTQIDIKPAITLLVVVVVAI